MLILSDTVLGLLFPIVATGVLFKAWPSYGQRCCRLMARHPLWFARVGILMAASLAALLVAAFAASDDTFDWLGELLGGAVTASVLCLGANMLYYATLVATRFSGRPTPAHMRRQL